MLGKGRLGDKEIKMYRNQACLTKTENEHKRTEEKTNGTMDWLTEGDIKWNW